MRKNMQMTAKLKRVRHHFIGNADKWETEIYHEVCSRCGKNVLAVQTPKQRRCYCLVRKGKHK